MPKDLSALFSPKSVAIIGASRTAEKVGAVVLKNIINSGFRGAVYPVNPNTTDINGLKCYADVASLPEVPDLAVIALPADLVLQTLNQIGGKGIKNTIVFAAGFKETGTDGQKLEKNLADIANKYSINLLGPNCLGFVNNLCPINATFGQLVNQSGNLRFISQSGAIAASIFDWCRSIGLGFSEFVTLGNKAVVNEVDILEHFLNQNINSAEAGLSNVCPVGMYLESISNGADFLRMMSEISKKDPVFIIKPGKSKAAATAMQSHTGAIASDDAVLQAVIQQAGAVRCETLEDFFDYSRAFSWENAPFGPKIAIISNAGGPAVISADAVVKEGLELAELDTLVYEKLKQVLPHASSLYNPVDILGDALADRFMQASEIVLQADQVHALLIILTPQIMTQIGKTAEEIGFLSKKYQKPIFCSFIGGSMVTEGEQKLNEYKIPSFRFPERAIAAIGAMWRWKQVRDERQETNINTKETFITQPSLIRINEIIQKAKLNNQKTLDNLEANEAVSLIGIPTPSTSEAADLGKAKIFAKENGWPVVLKLSSPGVLHKKKIGGVITDIWNEEYLETAWNDLEYKIPHLEPEIRDRIKIQIQKDVVNGVEVIIGVKRDSIFGPVILFGAGGTLAELIEDRNLRLLPVEISQAKSIVEQSKIYPSLSGKFGEPAYALDKLYEVIVRLGKLIEQIPEISEIEINPVIVTLNNVWAVDAKVVLAEEQKKPVVVPIFRVATTLKHEILASKFRYFEFETETPIAYKPGQYISVKVSNDRINCYSIANQVGQGKFSLLVDTSPGGPGSKFFENLKTGDKITYLGPFGTFTYKENDGAEHILFLGTGSGCAPLRAIIEEMLKGKNIQKPTTLYFGLRYSQDVFWKDCFQKLSLEHPNFNFKLALSKPDPSWQGLSGHITDLINQDISDFSKCSAYLCGNKKMVEEATNILFSKGCPKERIYSEKF